MGSPSAVLKGMRIARPEPIPRSDYRLRQGVLKLLAVKDSDIRILTLEQCRDAVDKGLHAGGAFSAVIPLTALYYGGFMDIDIADPTRRGQDLFTLSKGHAVAAMAAIYADLGYFGRDILRNSRSYSSILNGHPGPILPGVHIATGPMGQGFGVAQGFAIAGRISPRFDSYCMCGDGELQEGPIWEAVMFAGSKKLDNLCLMVDRNNGQLDIYSRTVFPMPDLAPVFRSFGWQACRRGRNPIRRRLHRARGVPLRSAQRQAHRDHLQHHQGARQPVRFLQPAQGGGGGLAAGAGIGAAKPAAARPRRRSSDASTRDWKRSRAARSCRKLWRIWPAACTCGCRPRRTMSSCIPTWAR